jgi:uncharacterized protein (DUF433 family)
MSTLQACEASGVSVDEATYTPNAAARHLRLPVSTVRWWTLGNGGHAPLIHIVAPNQQMLSFRNLVELHVLSAVMHQDGEHVPLAIVRAALTLVEERFCSLHPLADPAMDREGKEFFASRFATLTNSTRHRQVAIAAVLGAYLDRIHRDHLGTPIRLILFTRGRPEGPEHVMIDPTVRSGQPCLAGTAIRTAPLAERFLAGGSVCDIAEDEGRSPEEVEEAIRYETSPRYA